MDFAGLSQGRCPEKVQADSVILQCLLLALVVGGHIIFQPALISRFLLLPVALLNGRAVAIRPREEDDILLPDSVPQKSGKNISVHEHAAHMSKVQVLVAVGHACGDDGPFGECGPFVFHKTIPEHSCTCMMPLSSHHNPFSLISLSTTRRAARMAHMGNFHMRVRA